MKLKFLPFLLLPVTAGIYQKAASQAVNAQDSAALVDLYNSTDGPHWKHNTNWLTTAPVSSWYNVSLSGNRVTWLGLYNNNLKGVLPASIGNLTNLVTLYLSFNHLSGSIPDEIGNMTALNYIYINDNNLSGTIPSTIGNLVQLTDFQTHNNRLHGRLPSALGNLTNLVTLALYNNKLTGSIPISFRNLSKLTYLFLQQNNLSGVIPQNIVRLNPNLAMDITYNGFTFEGMELVAQRFVQASYGNQAIIPVHQNGNTLSVSAGGTLSNNTYSWFKVGGGTTSITGDSVFIAPSAGQYYAQVSNAVATQLILHTDTVIVSHALQSIAADNHITILPSPALMVYPNPAKNYINIHTDAADAFSLQVFNTSGVVVATQAISKNNKDTRLNITAYAKGTYIIQVNLPKAKLSTSFIKE